jgi:hypothetical protein
MGKCRIHTAAFPLLENSLLEMAIALRPGGPSEGPLMPFITSASLIVTGAGTGSPGRAGGSSRGCLALKLSERVVVVRYIKAFLAFHIKLNSPKKGGGKGVAECRRVGGNHPLTLWLKPC